MDGTDDRVEPTSIDDYPYLIYTTWRLSYDILSPRAQTLLRLCSHLHHTGITKEFFEDAFSSILDKEFTYPAVPFSAQEQSAVLHAQEFLGHSVDDVSKSWNTEEFGWCTQEACSSSLLSFDETRHYSIHPLIHDYLCGLEKNQTALVAAFVLASSICSSSDGQAVIGSVGASHAAPYGYVDYSHRAQKCTPHGTVKA